MDTQLNVRRFERVGKKHYFVLDVSINGENRILYRTYDDFYNLQIGLLNAFEGKNRERQLPYLPGPKFIVTESVSRARVPKLHDYCQDLMHLEPRISNCHLVLGFLNQRVEDMAITESLSDASRPTTGKSSGAAPWSAAGTWGRTAAKKTVALAKGDDCVGTAQSSASELPPRPNLNHVQARERTQSARSALSGGRVTSSMGELNRSATSSASDLKRLANVCKIRFGSETLNIAHKDNETVLSEFTARVSKKIGRDGKEVSLYYMEGGDKVVIDDDDTLRLGLSSGSLYVA